MRAMFLYDYLIVVLSNSVTVRYIGRGDKSVPWELNPNATQAGRI